ncbi:hypothetical protein BJ165DRAFT_1409347 [Panaeolus papilionaceus]|nr:hypothetical protein BJ165DRAFT_1409347 [Panaeolus papilionaceus]
MPELRVHVSSFNFTESVVVDSKGELLLTSCEESDSNVNGDADYDANSESDCGCSENQLSHHEVDGSVRTDLPERCCQRVDGPIGGAAAAEVESTPSNWTTSDQSDTEPKTIEFNSLAAEVASEQDIEPPANQLQQGLATHPTKAVIEQVKKRPPLAKRIKHRNHKVEAARKSSKKPKKTTCRDSGSLKRGDSQVTLKVLGNSHRLNITVSMNN